MKKILSLLFVVCFASSVSAQGFGARLLLGANFSQVDGDQLGGYNKLGANFGLEINRKISDDLEGAFEIRFSMKGARKVIDQEAAVPDPTLILRYNYLEVPLLLKYTHWDRIIPYAGVSIGVNVFNERDDDGRVGDEENLNPTEVALQLGGTYMITEKIGLDLRHGYSLLSVRDFQRVPNAPGLFQRTGWFNRLFTVGLVIDLGL